MLFVYLSDSMLDDESVDEDLLDEIEEKEEKLLSPAEGKEGTPENHKEPTQASHPEKVVASNARASRPSVRGGGKRTAIKAIRNMDVHLDFSLGQITIPLSRLEKMTPHQVLEDLQALSFPKVHILMGGKPFAEGSLVDIKGAIGCKILRFLS